MHVGKNIVRECFNLLVNCTIINFIMQSSFYNIIYCKWAIRLRVRLRVLPYKIDCCDFQPLTGKTFYQLVIITVLYGSNLANWIFFFTSGTLQALDYCRQLILTIFGDWNRMLVYLTYACYCSCCLAVKPDCVWVFILQSLNSLTSGVYRFRLMSLPDETTEVARRVFIIPKRTSLLENVSPGRRSTSLIANRLLPFLRLAIFVIMALTPCRVFLQHCLRVTARCLQVHQSCPN